MTARTRTARERRLLAGALLLLLALLLAGCRAGEEPTPGAPTEAAAAALPAEGSAGAPAETGAATAGSAEQETAPPPQPAAPTATPAVTPGRIVLWHSWAGADGDALAQILTNFRILYPDVAVDTLYVAYDDLPQSYADAVAAGGGPDLVFTTNWWLSDLVASGAALPLDGLLPDDSTAGYWPATLEAMRSEGRLYALPATFELVSLYANRNLAPGPDPATTDALLAGAQADPQKGLGLYANLYHLYWGIPAYGGALMDEGGRVVLDQTDGAAAFLGWLAQVRSTPGSFVDEDYGMLLDRFKKGEFAYFVDGPWALNELRGALGDALAVTPLPAGPTGPARPWLSADGLAINPGLDAEQQRRALLFAQFATGVDSGRLWALAAGRLPAQQAADVSADPALQSFVQQAATATPLPARAEMNEVWGYAGDMILKALNGVAAPGDTVREATTLINEANGR